MGRQQDSKTTGVVERGRIQAQLRGMTRNEVPYRKIAEELEKSEYKRIFTQCRERIKAGPEEAQGGSRPSNSNISFPFCIFPVRYVTKEHTTPGPCPHHPFLTHAPQQQTPGSQ